ncbi:MAG: cyclic nucleotide-binding domain-containing protein [Hyphomicrobiaceae bacterium]
MSISVLARQLMSQEIFRGLRPLQLTEIVRQAERIVYGPGDTIVEAGAAGDAAVLIVSGDAVRLVDGEPAFGLNTERVGAGSLLSELAMLVEHEHGATVVAHTTVRALRITRAGLKAQMLEDPDLASHFVDRITDRLSRVADELRRIDHALASAERIPSPA